LLFCANQLNIGDVVTDLVLFVHTTCGAKVHTKSTDLATVTKCVWHQYVSRASLMLLFEDNFLSSSLNCSYFLFPVCVIRLQTCLPCSCDVQL
jgi:hypothetical protein